MYFRKFLDELDNRGEMISLREEFSTEFEVSRKLSELDGGQAAVFERIRGHEMKLIGNIYGNRERIALSLEVENEKLISCLRNAQRNPLKPKEVDEAPVQEKVIENIDLKTLPILKHFEKDGGPYITSSILVAKDEEGIRNLSFHRMSLIGRNRLSVRLVPRDLHKIFSSAEDDDRDLEVAVIIGVHPAVGLAAATSVPYEIDEYGIAGALSSDLELVKCKNVDLEVPARAEIVLEGRLLAYKRVPEGPFADVTGTYDVVRDQPVFEIDCLTMREDAFYQAILPSGIEHQLLMGMPREPLIFEEVKKSVKVDNVTLTPGGCGWLHGVISILKENHDDGKKAIEAAFKAHPSMKHVVIVDNDINIHDSRDIEWAIATRSKADEDIMIKSSVKGSSLDPMSDPSTRIGSKMGIDATIDLNNPEKFKRAKIP